MFFGCCSAAGLSKRIDQKGTGDGGDSPQGVLDKFRFQYEPHDFLREINREPGNYYWDRLGPPWEPKEINQEAREYVSDS